MPKDKEEIPGLKRATEEAKKKDEVIVKKSPKNRAEFYKTFLPKED